MNPFFFLTLLLALSSIAAAKSQQAAVYYANTDVSLSFSDTDQYTNINVSADFNYPLTHYLGTKIQLQVSNGIGKDNYVDRESLAGGLQLFMRRSHIGKFGASYARNNTSFNAVVEDDSINIDSYQVFGEFYLKGYTFGLSRQLATNDANEQEINTLLFQAAHYPTNNSKITLVGGSMDARDNYAARFEFQPSYWKDQVSVAGFLSRDDAGNTAYGIGFTVFAGRAVVLKSRDRYLR